MAYWAVASGEATWTSQAAVIVNRPFSCRGLCEVGVNTRGLKVVVGCSASLSPSTSSQQ